jgi:hypothetical protein
MSGENHQFAPTLYQDNHILRNADVVTGEYHLTNDLVDQAVQSVTDVRSAARGSPTSSTSAPERVTRRIRPPQSG